jgi:hypothetical protein
MNFEWDEKKYTDAPNMDNGRIIKDFLPPEKLLFMKKNCHTDIKNKNELPHFQFFKCHFKIT